MADSIIAVAAKAKDWPLLHEAVDIKIEDQREFVAWWDEHVRSAGNPAITQDRGELAWREAEAEAGIRNQQVSRWRKALADPVAYHDKLVLAACRKEPDAAPGDRQADAPGVD